MAVLEKAGDLLTEKADAVVNTVNCVGVMGKGIAEQFKRKWPSNYKAYRTACNKNQVEPGKMFVFHADDMFGPKYIINFPTKLHWRNPSELNYIENGLRDLVRHVESLNIKSVAVPPLGCGNGGLEWDQVRPLIIDAFQKLPDVEVRLFPPNGAPAPTTMVTQSKRPSMTAGRAAVLMVFSAYKKMQYALSKIEAQKLSYFLQIAGEPLSLDFKKHTYGPYSDKLRHVLTRMEGHFIAGVGDHDGPAEITLKTDASNEAANFMNGRGLSAVRKRVNRVENLIRGFETPFGLELLSTVHWIAKEKNTSDFNEIKRGVEQWSDRKKKLFSEKDVRLAWARLRKNKWI